MSHGERSERCRRLPRRRRLRRRAVRGDRRRRAALSTGCSSIPRWRTRRDGGSAAANFLRQGRRLPGRLVDGGVPEQAIARVRAQVGRPRDLRALRRRGLLGRGGRSCTRRSATSSPASSSIPGCCGWASPRGGRGVPRPLQHPAGRRSTPPTGSSRASPASTIPRPSARSSATPSSTSSRRRGARRRRLPRAGHALPGRHRERLGQGGRA